MRLDRYDSPEHEEDDAADIAFDATGRVYVTGRTWEERTRWDAVTIASHRKGTLEWVARYNAGRRGEIGGAEGNVGGFYESDIVPGQAHTSGVAAFNEADRSPYSP